MLNDVEIDLLIKSPKICADKQSIKWKTHEKSRKLEIVVTSIDGLHSFVMYLRQNEIHENDFSCGLRLVRSGQDDVTLARYNGSSHRHVNKIEKDEISFKCHIHLATERYWNIGRKIEDYATSTVRYSNLSGAIQCMLVDYYISGLNVGQLIAQGGLLDEH